MKYLAFVLIVTAMTVRAQPNCNIFSGKCKEACEVYVRSEQYNQGTLRAHELYDSAIQLCPEFAYAHHEKSVGYLKNGEFVLWRKYMDEAVRQNPKLFLGNRGWCRFKFLHDYQGAIHDILEVRRMNNGVAGWSNDGDYDLRIVLALCYRELARSEEALREFESYFDSKRSDPNGLAFGSFDYLHFGETLLSQGKATEALAAFDSQIKIYQQLPDTYYYIAKIFADQGDKRRAREYLAKARAFYNQGFNRKDPYCEALDEVYPTDFERLQSSLD